MTYSREYGVSRPKRAKTRRSAETEEETRLKQLKAVELRTAGASFSEIAKALGYHDQSGAKKAVVAAIRRHEFEATADMLKLDLARLDEYSKIAYHALRTRNDLAQIDRLMRIMEKKHWLLGVTPATLAETQVDGSQKTAGGMNVVIASSERIFVRAMMQAVGTDPDSKEGRAYLKSKGLSEEPAEATPAIRVPSKRLLKKKRSARSTERLALESEQSAEVVGSRDDAMRDEAKRISVKRIDEQDVESEVVRLKSTRI